MIKVAVLGYGVVGSGVVSVLLRNKDRIRQNAGQEIEVKYILDIKKFPESSHKPLFTDSFDTIRNDPEIKIVVEVIGGTKAALDYTRQSLEAGKSVVTSNKELVALYGNELMNIAAEKGVNYLFEASVGGAIPIIRPLVQCMTANIIGEIYGILNGTTNYILTDMEKSGSDFNAALTEAQKKGYAESDPTADIEGHDTCRKICILSSIAFGSHVHPEHVQTEGIKGITIKDIQNAKALGYKVKLLGRSRSVGDKVLAFVAPHLVSDHSVLSGVDDVMNAVVIRGNAAGDVVFCGAGAGKLPTASAVVADIIDAVRHVHARRWIGWSAGTADMLIDPEFMESAWYIRTDATRDKVMREFGSVIFAENHNGGNANDGGEISFISTVINKRTLQDLLSRDITALSKFRILGDY
ncbi:MAG: homoserine dehydrogenase [Oscillospiraceae bacterium]|nr:homoserine dehydrogenase [Oscillospiraceae bacterium]MCL2278431.1 homoserine dehydrogenase [Oscillospiraceae bacterium]